MSGNLSSSFSTIKKYPLIPISRTGTSDRSGSAPSEEIKVDEALQPICSDIFRIQDKIDLVENDSTTPDAGVKLSQSLNRLTITKPVGATELKELVKRKVQLSNDVNKLIRYVGCNDVEQALKFLISKVNLYEILNAKMVELELLLSRDYHEDRRTQDVEVQNGRSMRHSRSSMESPSRKTSSLNMLGHDNSSRTPSYFWVVERCMSTLKKGNGIPELDLDKKPSFEKLLDCLQGKESVFMNPAQLKVFLNISNEFKDKAEKKGKIKEYRRMSTQINEKDRMIESLKSKIETKDKSEDSSTRNSEKTVEDRVESRLKDIEASLQDKMSNFENNLFKSVQDFKNSVMKKVESVNQKCCELSDQVRGMKFRITSEIQKFSKGNDSGRHHGYPSLERRPETSNSGGLHSSSTIPEGGDSPEINEMFRVKDEEVKRYYKERNDYAVKVAKLEAQMKKMQSLRSKEEVEAAEALNEMVKNLKEETIRQREEIEIREKTECEYIEKLDRMQQEADHHEEMEVFFNTKSQEYQEEISRLNTQIETLTIEVSSLNVKLQKAVEDVSNKDHELEVLNKRLQDKHLQTGYDDSYESVLRGELRTMRLSFEDKLRKRDAEIIDMKKSQNRQVRELRDKLETLNNTRDLLIKKLNFYLDKRKQQQ